MALSSFVLVIAVFVAAVAWSVMDLVGGHTQTSGVESFEWVEVSRRNLDTVVVAGGDLQPAKQTNVDCQVEDVTDSDGTMILSLVKNGAVVKKGDEMCRLDSSAIEELARQEEILVHKAKASHRKARLELEIAMTALLEYRDGLVIQSSKDFEARIALGRSDVKRQEDRLAWSEAMAKKGYLATGQLLTERQTLARLRHELARVEGEFQLFREFQVPKELHALRGRIKMAENSKRLEADRLKSEEDELAYLRKQIENCTVRAPHDGVAIYANCGYWWAHPLEPGMRVYQEQGMFLLPELGKMEVDVSVHETMGARIRVGMKADVHVASQGDRVIPGRVVAVSMLPTSNWKEWDENLKHFLVRVRLDNTPASALPFMSAAVEIDTGHVADALVIPVEALAMKDGQQACYVVANNQLERRTIKTRHATRDLLEVIEGLHEGERIVSHSIAVDENRDGEIIRVPTEGVARNQTTRPAAPDVSARVTPRVAVPPASSKHSTS